MRKWQGPPRTPAMFQGAEDAKVPRDLRHQLRGARRPQKGSAPKTRGKEAEGAVEEHVVPHARKRGGGLGSGTPRNQQDLPRRGTPETQELRWGRIPAFPLALKEGTTPTLHPKDPRRGPDRSCNFLRPEGWRARAGCYMAFGKWGEDTATGMPA